MSGITPQSPRARLYPPEIYIAFCSPLQGEKHGPSNLEVTNGEKGKPARVNADHVPQADISVLTRLGAHFIQEGEYCRVKLLRPLQRRKVTYIS